MGILRFGDSHFISVCFILILRMFVLVVYSDVFVYVDEFDVVDQCWIVGNLCNVDGKILPLPSWYVKC